jgi:hypothetical protein
MDFTLLMKDRGNPWRCVLLMGALLWLAGCATGSALHERGGHSAPEGPSDDGGGFGFFREQKDDFQVLQQSSGLEEDSWHAAGAELETDDAQDLWEVLVRSRTTLNTFGPKRSLLFVLRQVLEADKDMPYAELVQRCRPFRSLVVVRPDGYMASALDGEPLERAGRVELREGRLLVGGRYEVAAFYRNKMGVFYPVDGALQQSSIIPLGELGLGRDWLNAALDGSEDALAETVMALAHLVTDPVRSLQGLAQLPSAVAALIASSPEYFARYSALPLQEQIREAGRLSTHLLMLFGSAAGTATKIGTTGTRLPVLSLMADGSLAIERVSVPAGSSAAVLGVGAGAVYVLSSPEKAPDDRSDDLTAARGATQPFGGLSRAAEFGIRQYNLLRQALQGTGLRAHHLIEQRFARIMGQDARKELCVAVTPSEHQAFTNDWRAAIPYGEGTANATRELILREAARIYADYPAILQALGL